MSNRGLTSIVTEKFLTQLCHRSRCLCRSAIAGDWWRYTDYRFIGISSYPALSATSSWERNMSTMSRKLATVAFGALLVVSAGARAAQELPPFFQSFEGLDADANGRIGIDEAYQVQIAHGAKRHDCARYWQRTTGWALTTPPLTPF
jgi:hypothetical protein